MLLPDRTPSSCREVKIGLGGSDEDGNATGDFDITDSVTIRAVAQVSPLLTASSDRVFDVLGGSPSSIKVVFQGLTVRDGQVTGDGGGIRVGNADLVVWI